jgi:hypothetical protein
MRSSSRVRDLGGPLQRLGELAAVSSRSRSASIETPIGSALVMSTADFDPAPLKTSENHDPHRGINHLGLTFGWKRRVFGCFWNEHRRQRGIDLDREWRAGSPLILRSTGDVDTQHLGAGVIQPVDDRVG